MPTDMLKKFQFLTQKGISPHCDTDKKVRSLTKSERIKYGIEKDLRKEKPTKTVMKDYLNKPLTNADHPI